MKNDLEVHAFFKLRMRQSVVDLYRNIISFFYYHRAERDHKSFFELKISFGSVGSVVVKKASIYFILIFICRSQGHASLEPWGKDADIALKRTTIAKTAESCKTPLVGAIGEAVITFHQTSITQCDGPRSNFRPSSSQYMLDAMRKYGFFEGFSMGCDRLIRENDDPWVYRTTLSETQHFMKYDPVQ